MFEVLHYVGSCIIKILKLRLFGDGEKGGDRDRERDREEATTDPLLPRAENRVFMDTTVFVDRNVMEGEEQLH